MFIIWWISCFLWVSRLIKHLLSKTNSQFQYTEEIMNKFLSQIIYLWKIVYTQFTKNIIKYDISMWKWVKYDHIYEHNKITNILNSVEVCMLLLE